MSHSLPLPEFLDRITDPKVKAELTAEVLRIRAEVAAEWDRCNDLR